VGRLRVRRKPKNMSEFPERFPWREFEQEVEIVSKRKDGRGVQTESGVNAWKTGKVSSEFEETIKQGKKNQKRKFTLGRTNKRRGRK